MSYAITNSVTIRLPAGSAPASTGSQMSLTGGTLAVGRYASDRDAFGRLRISSPNTLLDNKFTFINNELVWVSQASGSGVLAHSKQKSAMVHSISGSGESIYQTRRYFNYQSGKSHLIFCTFGGVVGSDSLVKSIGYFDDDNGVFLELSGTDAYMVQRYTTTGSTTERRIAQSNWNITSMSGTLDFTKAQIFVADLEWLGVGRVRTGFVVDGFVIYTHEFLHANNDVGVWAQTANLPIRYSLSGTEGSGSFDQICATVIVEGGVNDSLGIKRSVNRALTGSTIVGVIEPLISIRLQDEHKRATIKPINLEVITSTNANFMWELRLNPTIVGGTSSSWQSVTGSVIEYDIARNGNTGTESGYVIASGYGTARVNQAVYSLQDFLTLGANIDGTERDELVLSVAKIGGGSDTFFGALTWEEIL